MEATSSQRPRSYDFGTLRIFAGSLNDAVDALLAAAGTKMPIRVHFLTAHSVACAERDAALAYVYQTADLLLPDGMPLVWYGRLIGHNMHRVCGPDLLPTALDRSRSEGYTHYFLGGTDHTLHRLVERLSLRFPGVRIVGSYAPPFRALTDGERRVTVRMINEVNPDFLWVGLGTPKQDMWLADCRPQLSARIMLAVGAAFDFHAGTRQRAPVLMQRTGTEWLFRLAQEPLRLIHRYTVDNSVFAKVAVRELLNRR